MQTVKVAYDEAMESQPTVVPPPIHLRIADDIRMRIEQGELVPGAPLPTLNELTEQWFCSMTSARHAITLLKQQGLIEGGRGKAPVVRRPPTRVVRSNTRHQDEKDRVRLSEEERRTHGEAEDDLGTSLDQVRFTSTYNVVRADGELASAFNVEPGTEVLRREYETIDPRSGLLQAHSLSYIPVELISSNPVLLSSDCEPWPGGTQHQLSTVGIEIMSVVDQVTAAMPTTVEVQQWGLSDGVPLLTVRRISLDTDDRPVEISDAQYPADRTELHFTTPLRRADRKAKR